jgi:hypothetical protein
MNRSALFDVFVCHASEDKNDFVRPLAEVLRQKNVDVWYDEFSLKVGDSIRRSLDRGLRSCRYGIVVLSGAFFRKNWPQYELDALVEREITAGEQLVLPIWHGVTHDEVLRYSPALAGKKALSTTLGMDAIARELLQVIRPSGSPLLVARELLVEHGLRPPVVTDPYWLEVVEASNRLLSFGAYVPPEATWGRWCFPLPARDDGADAWGSRLAWTALQLSWCTAAEERLISPLTKPADVLNFIHSLPGLKQMCDHFPDLTAAWAPQLVIPGFGGEFEIAFETAFTESRRESGQQAKLSPRVGAALTINGQPPTCGQSWSLRDLHFGYYESSIVANNYFGGEIFGPGPSPFEHSDHLFWLLSDKSCWLPPRIQDCLLDGMAKWGTWVWGEYTAGGGSNGDWKESGRLHEALLRSNDLNKRLRWNRAMKEDLLHRAKYARKLLTLPEHESELVERFHDENIIERYLERRKERRRKGRAPKA